MAEKTKSLNENVTSAYLKRSPASYTEELYFKIFACMFLSAIGDAIGYKNGEWEFNSDTSDLHDQAKKLGGVENIVINKKDWRVSDDTVMHMASARALIHSQSKKMCKELWSSLCSEYVKCWTLMDGRSPGLACADAMPYLKDKKLIPYSAKGGGCGAAMRTMCIGLVYRKHSQLQDLVEISLEASRCTNNHPTGFLGGVMSAVFTSYATRDVSIFQWPFLFFQDVYPLCIEYIQKNKKLFDLYNDNSLHYFRDKWMEFMKMRQINHAGCSNGVYDADFVEDPLVRHNCYTKSFSFSGWAGSSGHDCVILAYDALLFSEGSWKKFLEWSALHGGDSDSTAAIGGAWFGAYHGFHHDKIPQNHYENLEFKEELSQIALDLLCLTRFN